MMCICTCRETPSPASQHHCGLAPAPEVAGDMSAAQVGDVVEAGQKLMVLEAMKVRRQADLILL